MMVHVCIGEIDPQEGVAPFTFGAFRVIAEYALRAISAWYGLFHLLCWNLMARSINVADLTYSHISMNGDCLAIKFSHDKTHAEGDNLIRNVYANPVQPSVCVFLGFGLQILTTPPEVVAGLAMRVFCASGESSFGKWLKTTVVTIATSATDKLRLDGFNLSLCGTHSNRKGSITFSATHPDGPSGISLFLRAGWSLGDVQARYLFRVRKV
jgi:hypothetical protein